MRLKEKIDISFTETIRDLNVGDESVVIIDNFIKELDSYSLHSISSEQTLDSIKEFILKENQNTLLDFLVLFNSKLFINEVTDNELDKYLESLISIYDEKNVGGILTKEFIHDATSKDYNSIGRLYKLITVLALNSQVIIILINNKYRGA